MEITCNVSDELASIAVTGKLTVQTAPELEQAIAEVSQTAKDIDIDFTDLDYISSAGLRVLVGTERATKTKGGTMRILHPDDKVYEVFEMTGLADVLTIER